MPQNYEAGFYHDLFYLITDKFDGQLLVARPEKNEVASKKILSNLSLIIDFAETIQKLQLCHSRESGNPDSCEKPGSPIRSGMTSYQEYFLQKTKLWYEDIPEVIKEKYQIIDLLNLVKDSYQTLQKRPRHGDFTPWHLMVLKNSKLGLIDAEHWLSQGVENYDICYFVQRVYSVLENPGLAREILALLIKREYKTEKLKPVLAARAIGGFLDEMLKEKPNYQKAASFKEFVKSF